jgi:CubicO group peptidase (beta-lactamase class C family)
MKGNNFLTFVLSGLIILIISCNPSVNVTTPEDVGLSSDSLELASKKMQEYIDSGRLAGISTLIIKNGVQVQLENFGYSDIENQKPIEDNTIYRMFSMTKPITAAALMTLYDEGKFKLDDRVADYIPEFEGLKVFNNDGSNYAELEGDLTIRHLLTHTSGISYGWGRNHVDSLYRANDVGSWDQTLGEMMKKLAKMPLNFQPGTNYEYGLSIDVAGYLIEVLSGETLDKFFEARIFDPLKMPDTRFHVPEGKYERFSEVYSRDERGALVKPGGDFEDRFTKPAVTFSGGGGLVGTIGDYARFCMMLRNGGELDGVRILEESSVQLIMSNQMPEIAQNVKFGKGMGYGLGGSVNLETDEYSWGGAAGTKFWINPTEDLIIVTCIQLMPGDARYASDFKSLVENAIIE